MIKNLFGKYKIRPSKRLGQNFLINKRVLGKIIEAADLSKNDLVLEIGPGLGILTLELAKKVKKVIAIEKDRRMVEIVRNVINDRNVRNVKIVEGDILKFKILNLKFKIYKVVANIPYYLTSILIRKFLEAKNPPKEMILMVQKEVAQRICSQAPKMSLLAMAVQFYSQPKIIDYISKKSFWPQPKVDSAIIKISNIKYQISKVKSQKFFQVVRAGFQAPRKQLLNNLSKGLNLDRQKTKKLLLKVKINPSSRAQTLTVDNWKKLASFINKNMLK